MEGPTCICGQPRFEPQYGPGAEIFDGRLCFECNAKVSSRDARMDESSDASNNREDSESSEEVVPRSSIVGDAAASDVAPSAPFVATASGPSAPLQPTVASALVPSTPGPSFAVDEMLQTKYGFGMFVSSQAGHDGMPTIVKLKTLWGAVMYVSEKNVWRESDAGILAVPSQPSKKGPLNMFDQVGKGEVERTIMGTDKPSVWRAAPREAGKQSTSLTLVSLNGEDVESVATSSGSFQVLGGLYTHSTKSVIGFPVRAVANNETLLVVCLLKPISGTNFARQAVVQTHTGKLELRPWTAVENLLGREDCEELPLSLTPAGLLQMTKEGIAIKDKTIKALITTPAKAVVDLTRGEKGENKRTLRSSASKDSVSSDYDDNDDEDEDDDDDDQRKKRQKSGVVKSTRGKDKVKGKVRTKGTVNNLRAIKTVKGPGKCSGKHSRKDQDNGGGKRQNKVKAPKKRPPSPQPPLIIICDGCNAEVPFSTCGLEAVPDGDWFCNTCNKKKTAKRHKTSPTAPQVTQSSSASAATAPTSSVTHSVTIQGPVANLAAMEAQRKNLQLQLLLSLAGTGQGDVVAGFLAQGNL